LIAFLASFRDLCLFRRGPEDMPYAPWLLVALLIVAAIAEAAFDLHGGVRAGVVAAASIGTLATLAALLGLLRWRGRPERFVQTALALVASSLLFELIAMPLTLVIGHPVSPADIRGGQVLATLAVLVLAIWQVCISVNVLRRALDIPVAGGVLALLLLGFVDLFVTALGTAALGIT